MTRARRYKARARRHLKFRLPLPTLLALAVLLALDGTGVLRLSLLCALLHEAGHLLVYVWLLRRWPVVELSPAGLCLRMRGVLLPPAQEFLLAAAGPLANLLCCCLVFLWMRCFGGYSYAGYWFASANLLVGGANLLPLPGLDGARMLACCGFELHF